MKLSLNVTMSLMYILLRTLVRRQELLQKHVEKCEEILSAKAEAKEALAKEVMYSSEPTLHAIRCSVVA